MKNEKRLTINAELRANAPQGTTPEDQADDQNQQDQQQKQDPKQPNTVEGYALLFNQPSKDLGGFVEVIDPKALDNVDLSKVVMLDQHDYSKPLASVEAGTLKLDVDDKGLHFVAQLDDNVSYAKDTLNNVKNGNINSMSFRFDVDDGSDTWTQDDDQVVRTVNQIKDLFEVSTVTVPAYDDTNVNVDDTTTRSYNQFIESEEKRNMAMKTIIDPKKNVEGTETPEEAFGHFLRTGETRDGLTSAGVNKAVIPDEVITPVFELKYSKDDLAKYTTTKTVTTRSGHLPVLNATKAVLTTKDELKEIPDATPDLYTDVTFDVHTYGAKIYLSQELVDDAATDVVGDVKKQYGKFVTNTDNAEVTKLLTSDVFRKVTASSANPVDDIKKVYNTMLDPALDKMFVTNADGFNALDQLKDSEQRYLLQPSPSDASAFTLLGAPVVIISNNFLPDNKDGSFPLICGDLSQAVLIARRNQTQATWNAFDDYGLGISILARNDYQVISKDAAVNISLPAPAAAGK